MAFDWEHVEAIRAEQDSARNRRDLNTLPTDEVSNEIYNSPSGRNAKAPGLDHWEQMIHKVRTQLIDYIIEHGLVQGFEYDGVNEPIKNGKIVITAEMLQRVTDRFGYFKEKETLEFIEKYLPEHHYVADENYVHTDNNYTDAEKAKLEGIADGAEANKVISVLFNGVETIDPETRIATITITPADVKTWYEQNPDTNVFTDAEKAKLESINLDELSNKVEDVTLDGETIVKNKIAILTAKKIKDSYESNADTNAFTDADKALVEQVLPEVQKGVSQHEQRIDALEKSQIAQDAEIKDAKDSISGLGNEVNSVAGRVTTLETSQKTQDGRLDALETWKGTTDTTLTELGEKNATQDEEISKLKEKNTSQDGEISNIKTKDTEQDGRLDALETSEETQDADIAQLKKDVKNAGKVDDVTVGGVSVIENKVAKIPVIPSADVFVPYAGATKDVNIGDNSLIVKATGSSSDLPISSEIRVGKTTEAESGDLIPEISISTELNGTVSGQRIRSSFEANANYDGLFARVESEQGDNFASAELNFSDHGLSVRDPQTSKTTLVKPGLVRGLDLPATNDSAANKEYVDDKFRNIGQEISVTTEEFSLPNMPAGNSVVLTRIIAYTGKEVLGMVPYSETTNLLVVPTFRNTTGGFNLLTVQITNVSTNVAIGSGTKCGVNVTLRPKTE